MTDLEASQRLAVVTEARAWLLTPYHHEGRVKGLGGGVDCAMLPAEVYHAAGVIPAIPELTYDPQWHLHHSAERYLEWVLKYAREIAGPPQPGDMALYKYGHTLSHGAIVIAWPQVIHAVRDRAVEWGNGAQMIINGHRAKDVRFYRFQGWI